MDTDFNYTTSAPSLVRRAAGELEMLKEGIMLDVKRQMFGTTPWIEEQIENNMWWTDYFHGGSHYADERAALRKDRTVRACRALVSRYHEEREQRRRRRRRLWSALNPFPRGYWSLYDD